MSMEKRIRKIIKKEMKAMVKVLTKYPDLETKIDKYLEEKYNITDFNAFQDKLFNDRNFYSEFMSFYYNAKKEMKINV